ncbi:MAG TPA: N-acetyl-gamma-glutamyl-phosphate reductase [Savagea sp.]
MKIAIIGATGFGGAELIRLLHSHSKVEAIDVFTSSEVGELYSNKYPSMIQIYDQPLLEINYSKLAQYDVIFASTPAGVTSTLFEPLMDKEVVLIDLSGDYRLKNLEDYENWYGKKSAKQQYVDKAVYGLTEWAKANVKGATFISNPGCYPTAALLSTIPLYKEDLVIPGTCIIDAKSGVTGSGNSLVKSSHFCEANENISIYKMNKHQHIPEIEQGLKMFAGAEDTITFSTHLVPMMRGILSTTYINVKEGTTEDMIQRAFEEAYKDAPFVRLIEEAGMFGTNRVRGTNYCDIHWNLDERTNRLTVVAAIDNLVKGAAGQAIQNMNVLFGYDEMDGLDQIPLYM